MADERRIIRGELEDANGNVLHPNTSAGQVITADGKTIEDKLREYDNMAGATIPTGGTAGQLLAKQSDTDHDAAWIDPPETETAESILEKLKTVDGEGSGLDADMLGGISNDMYMTVMDYGAGGNGKQVEDSMKLGGASATAYMKVSQYVNGTAYVANARNADKLGEFTASSYMKAATYAGTATTSGKTPVTMAYNLVNSAQTRFISGSNVVRSLSSNAALDIEVVTSLPSSKSASTLYFVKE